MAFERKQITRNRTSYSCQMCRRRKVRCDKQHPRCGGCMKANEVCVYGDPDTSTSDVARSSVVVDGVPIRKRRAIDDDTNDSNNDRQPATALQSIEQKLSHLTNLVRGINRLTPDSNNSPSEALQSSAFKTSHQNLPSESEAPRSPADDDSNYDPLPDTSADKGTPWEIILRNLGQLNRLLKPSVENPAETRTSEPTNAAVKPSQTGREDDTNFSRMILHELMAPTESEAAVLFRSWMWSIYPVLPIVSPKVVHEKYQAFRQWYLKGLDNGDANPDPTFMPFLHTVWHTGFENLSDKARRKWFAWVPNDDTWRYGIQIRVEADLADIKQGSNPSIYSLAAAITTQYLGMSGQDIMRNHTDNIFSIRTAQSLGLHNEASFESMTTKEAEMRRRVLWEALSIDATISTVSGVPVVLDERYANTNMISDLKEFCMDTVDAAEYAMHLGESGSSPDRPDDPNNSQTSSLVSVYHLVARARHILTVATKHVLRANMSAAPMTMEEIKAIRKSVQQASNEVRGIINCIQTRGIPELDFVPDTNPPSEIDHLDIMGEEVTSEEIDYFLRNKACPINTSPIMRHHRATTIAFHKWARIMLSMSIDRLECITYGPFLKKSKSRLWAVARNCALRSCHGYMRKFLSLAEDPQLRMFRWAWTGTYHPMHATIIMLVDVHDRPHSDEAPRSRAMIDKIFSLISGPKIMNFPQYGSTNVLPLREGGDEVWTMLRRLRHKAWQNAGLDPDVLWTEEDQMSVGIGKPLSENDLFVRSLREDIIHSHKLRQSRANESANFHGISSHINSRLISHPSVLGQGDRVTGPVIKGVEDFENLSIVPDILLLRASNDQELMPYPVTSNGHGEKPNQKTASRDEPNYTSNQPTDGPQAFNIGELIRKIQQTKRSKLDPTTSAEVSSSIPPANPLPLQDSPSESPNCDFRTLRAAENAAFQDVSEKLSSAENPPPISNTTIDHHVKFANFPTALTNSTVPQGTWGRGEWPLAHRQQSLLSQKNPNVPPVQTETSHDYEQEKEQREEYNQQTETNGPTSVNPYSSQSPLIDSNPLPSGKIDADTAMEIDFDWDRWDEMFGQFAGFEDMLMEDYALAHVND